MRAIQKSPRVIAREQTRPPGSLPGKAPKVTPKFSALAEDEPDAGLGLALGPLPGYLGYPLRRAQIAVFEDFMLAAGSVGLRPGQFSTLVVIGANPGSKQTDVASALGIQGTNFVAMINQLEERGLVERRVFDRRTYALHLTDDGRKLMEAGVALQEAQEASYEEILGPGGRQILLGLLARLTAGLDARKAGRR